MVLIPIIYDNSIEDVIELISFKEVTDYKIKLIEEVCKNLGAALINERTTKEIQEMLEETNMHRETLSAHEEELCQNIKELTATQEESAKREENLLKKNEKVKGHSCN